MSDDILSDDASDEDKPKKQKTRGSKKRGMKEHIQEMLADLRVPDDDVREEKVRWGGWAYAPESDGSINRGLVRNIVGKGSCRQIDLVCEGHEKETFLYDSDQVFPTREQAAAYFRSIR